jgi:hypothetical protein
MEKVKELQASRERKLQARQRYEEYVQVGQHSAQMLLAGSCHLRHKHP